MGWSLACAVFLHLGRGSAVSRQYREALLRAEAVRLSFSMDPFRCIRLKQLAQFVLMVQAHVDGVVRSCPQSARLYEDHESMGVPVWMFPCFLRLLFTKRSWPLQKRFVCACTSTETMTG